MQSTAPLLTPIICDYHRYHSKGSPPFTAHAVDFCCRLLHVQWHIQCHIEYPRANEPARPHRNLQRMRCRQPGLVPERVQLPLECPQRVVPGGYTARMTIKDRLTQDLKEAMRAKDTVRLDAIRAIRAAVTLREVETKTDLDDAAVVELIRTLRKQRLESIALFEQGGRADLVERETREKELLEAYLPQAPTREAIETGVAAVIAELGATSVKDMGRVMQASKERLAGADGKLLSEVVRALLTR